MFKSPLSKVLSLYLIAALFILSLPASGWAVFLPSTDPASARTTDMANIQATIESSVIKQRLLDYGLTAAETEERLNALSDEQIHQLAANLDAIQAGGDSLGAVVFLLLVVLVVIVVLEVTGHRVVIRR
jgi:hypothetical protein